MVFTMTKTYTPRRANLTRWLQGAPDYVLDVLDSPKFADRYTVMFTKEMSSVTGSYADTLISYLSMSDSPTHPQGVSLWSEMSAYDAASYRTASHHRRIRWLDLPENVRTHVIARATYKQ